VSDIDLSETATEDLFALYRSTLAELKSRGIVRTENAPAGDYAEYLVSCAYGGELAPNSERSWDVLLPGGGRVQVKARVVSNPVKPSQRQLSPFRSFDFDSAIIVFLSDVDYSIQRAVKVSRDAVESSSSFSSHVNGSILRVSEQFLAGPEVVDVTDQLRAVVGGEGQARNLN